MKKKHKILFLVQLPPPIHGVSVMNQHAVDDPLIREKYHVQVLSMDFSQNLQDIGKITAGKLLQMFAFTFRLFYTLLSFNPRIVYFTIMPTGKIFYRDALFGLLIKLFRCKLIVHLHGKGIRESAQKGKFVRWLYIKLFKNAAVICLSSRLSDDIKEVHGGQVFILPNGVPPFAPDLSLQPNHQPVIIYLSNLVKSKGIEVFLKSLVKLHSKGIEFCAKVVGESVDMTVEQARQFASINDLSDRLEVTGPKYGHEKIKALQQSDIFVLPSLNESFPLSILEAMQAGLPVVSTIVGGIPDMIEQEKEGLLVQANDIDALALALERLLVNPDQRKRLGVNARDKFEANFTIERFNLGLAAIIDKVNSQ